MKMKIDEYIRKGYDLGFDLFDLFFDENKRTNYYEPMSIENVLIIFSETIEDLFYNFEISRTNLENVNYSQLEYFEILRQLIIKKIDRFIRREEYRITGLWRSTQLDDDYSPLDNVFEENIERVTRTPNLRFDETGGFVQGAQTNQSTDSLGARTDSSTRADDVTAFNTTTAMRTTGNTSGNTTGSQTNSTTDSIGGRTDSSSNLKTETGNEVTVYEKNRHGNIGTTTSAQLLGGDRECHDFSFYETIGKLMVLEFCDSVFDRW